MRPDRRSCWPADFLLRVRYSLNQTTLRMDVEIENPGPDPLPWGFGTHPYFRLPLGPDSDPKHCIMEVPAAKAWELESCLPTGQRNPVTPEQDLREGAYFDVLQFDDVLTGLTSSDGHVACRIVDEKAGLEIVQRCPADFPRNGRLHATGSQRLLHRAIYLRDRCDSPATAGSRRRAARSRPGPYVSHLDRDSSRVSPRLERVRSTAATTDRDSSERACPTTSMTNSNLVVATREKRGHRLPGGRSQNAESSVIPGQSEEFSSTRAARIPRSAQEDGVGFAKLIGPMNSPETNTGVMLEFVRSIVAGGRGRLRAVVGSRPRRGRTRG